MPLSAADDNTIHPGIRAIADAFSDRRWTVWRLMWVSLAVGIYALRDQSTHASTLLVWTVLSMAVTVALSLWGIVRWSGHKGPIVSRVAAVLDFALLALLLVLDLAIFAPLVVALPIVTIIAGIRFHYRALLIGMGVSAAIVLLAAAASPVPVPPATQVTHVLLVLIIPLFLHASLRLLRHMAVSATDASTAKTRFLASMSHELRTPLHAIITTGAVLDSEPLTPVQRELARTIDVNAKALRHLVADVMDLSTIETGAVMLRQEPFRLRPTLSNVRYVIEPQARAKGLACTVLVEDAVPDRLQGDGERIEQVLVNLMGNAVKYTDRGSVRLEVRAKPVDQGASTEVEFRVVDTGPGIPQSEKRRIFDAFYQISQGHTRRYGGAGLGLSVVKLVSDRMRGKVSVDDNPQGGAIVTWTVRLPILGGDDTRDTQDVRGAELFEQHRRTVPSRHVLVIEDQPANRIALGMFLERAGHRVTAAPDGPTGLRLLREAAFDLVLLDLHMPGMSGWEVLEEVARRPGLHAAPPISILSAEVSSDALDAAYQKGARSYLTKPVVVADLLDLLANVPLPSQRTKESATSALDTFRSISSPSQMVELIDSLIVSLREQAEAMTLASARGDGFALGEIFHTIKGLAGQSGLDQLAETSRLAEGQIKQGHDHEGLVQQMEAALRQGVLTLESQPEMRGRVQSAKS
jgi:two-component system sensor histidine kinase RpfC